MPALAQKFRARGRKRVPPRSVRIAKSPRLPAAASLAYQLRARQVAALWARRARALFLPLAKAQAEREDGAPLPSTAEALHSLRAYGAELARSKKLGSAIARLGRDVARHTANEFERLAIGKRDAKPAKRLNAKRLVARTDDTKGGTATAASGVAGVQYSSLGLDDQISAWRDRNVSLITGALGEQADKIADLLEQHAGSSYETIAKALEERFGITSRRAELIARDQVLTLNSQITRERMQRAGINRYVWTTTGDERVRGDPGGKYPDSDEDHYSLDGETFSFDDPPIVNTKTGERANPGEPIQCRCVAYPAEDDIFGGEPEHGEESDEPEIAEPAPPATPVAKPAPAENELVKGVHVKRLLFDSPEARATWDRLKTSLSDGDLAYLKEKPLERLSFMRQLEIQGVRPNGYYLPDSQELSVGVMRAQGTFGQEFGPGVWSVSKAGATEQDAVHRTFVHEFAHHIHYSGGADVDAIVQEAFKVGQDTCITEYGRTSAEEYFAECFATHRFHPEELEKHDRNGLEMVKRVLALRDRPAKASIGDI